MSDFYTTLGLVNVFDGYPGRNPTWDKRFLGLAEHISQWSKDPSTQVGAVIVDPDKRVVSVGYNGFAKGVEDDNYKYLDKDYKYSIIVHGEVNAILFAQRSLKGCTLYTHPFMPCSRCAAMIIQTGISRVVARNNNRPDWYENFLISKQLFKEAEVKLDLL